MVIPFDVLDFPTRILCGHEDLAVDWGVLEYPNMEAYMKKVEELD